jgi:hypothetical protein
MPKLQRNLPPKEDVDDFSERLFVYVKVLDDAFREYSSLSLLRQHRAIPDVQFHFLRSRY